VKPALQFSHANGFPAGCYRAFLAPLAGPFRIGAVEAFGTDPRYPVTERWLHLVEQLVDELVARWRGEPVYGVGHSLGGYLTFLAAVQRPELFRAIVLLDAPILGAVKGALLGATKRIGIVDRVTPAAAARERRSEWPSRAAAREHFRVRPPYRAFDRECLEDWLRAGLVRQGGRLRLRIPPQTEAHIYRTFPHDMARHLPRLAVPAAFVGGTRSEVIARVGMRTMRGPRFLKRRVPGSHLFPFERPREAAAAVAELIGALASHAC